MVFDGPWLIFCLSCSDNALSSTVTPRGYYLGDTAAMTTFQDTVNNSNKVEVVSSSCYSIVIYSLADSRIINHACING